MKYSRSIIEIIKERSSRRSYTPQPVEAEKLGALSDFFAALEGPFGGRARFVILDTTGWGEQKINALGTYGTMQGARIFIVGIIRRGEHDMEDFGYQFEQIILRATDLGLGTCWIGGIFNRSRFADKADVREDEVLPAISPLGYPTPKRSVTDSIIRWSAGSRSRRPWRQLFFHGSFEMALPEGAAGRYLDPLEMLRLGPLRVQPADLARRQGAGEGYLSPLSAPLERVRQAHQGRGPPAHGHGHRHEPFRADGQGVGPRRTVGEDATLLESPS
jgi:Putative TM nitroreductase